MNCIPESEPRTRYAVMARLLSESDVQFVAARGGRKLARQLRTQHRRIYLLYWRELAREMNAARRALRTQMEGRQDWDFERLLANERQCFAILARLRWAAVRHAVGLPVDGSLIEHLLAAADEWWLRGTLIPLETR